MVCRGSRDGADQEPGTPREVWQEARIKCRGPQVAWPQAGQGRSSGGGAGYSKGCRGDGEWSLVTQRWRLGWLSRFRRLVALRGTEPPPSATRAALLCILLFPEVEVVVETWLPPPETQAQVQGWARSFAVQKPRNWCRNILVRDRPHLRNRYRRRDWLCSAIPHIGNRNGHEVQLEPHHPQLRNGSWCRVLSHRGSLSQSSSLWKGPHRCIAHSSFHGSVTHTTQNVFFVLNCVTNKTWKIVSLFYWVRN